MAKKSVVKEEGIVLPNVIMSTPELTVEEGPVVEETVIEDSEEEIIDLDAKFSDYVKPEETPEPVTETIQEAIVPSVITEMANDVITEKEKIQMKIDENKIVRLDGNPVTLRYIKEQQKTRTDIRIVETYPGEYKTLQRMNG